MLMISVFTGKDLNLFRKENGIGYWVVKSSRILSAKYVLLIRNRRTKWAIKDLKHGQAFMIGKISGCISSPDYPGRKIIQISEYSMLPNTEQFKGAWEKLTYGQRYPVSYLKEEYIWEKLPIKVDELEWLPFENSIQLPEDTNDKKDLYEIITESKEKIAHAANVSLDKIDIKIHF